MVTIEDVYGSFTELANDVKCAFCLNPRPTNKKTLDDKAATTGPLHDNGKAVAFLCEDCAKDENKQPKFSHQIGEKLDGVKFVSQTPVEVLGEYKEGQKHYVSTAEQQKAIQEEQTKQQSEAATEQNVGSVGKEQIDQQQKAVQQANEAQVAKSKVEPTTTK
jgi:hypothetical protein